LFESCKGSNVFFEINKDENSIFKYKPQKMKENKFGLAVDMIGIFGMLHPNVFLDQGLNYLAPEQITPENISFKIRRRLGSFPDNKKVLRHKIKENNVFPNFTLKVRIEDVKTNQTLHVSTHNMFIILY